MKNLITFILIFISTMINKPIEYIKVEHIGISDKPIPTIIISKDTIKLPKVDYSIINYAIVDYNDYTMIVTALNRIKNDRFNVAEFGTFKITINVNNKIQAIHCLNKKSSVRLFNEMMEKLKKESRNSDLVSDLEELKKRLGFGSVTK